MMLDPLTEVVVRVLVPVCIRSGQFVMDILRNCEGGKNEQDRDDPGYDSGSYHWKQHGRAWQQSH